MQTKPNHRIFMSPAGDKHIKTIVPTFKIWIASNLVGFLSYDNILENLEGLFQS